MGILSWKRQRKQRVGRVVKMSGEKPRYMEKNGKAFAKEGYGMNVIVFRCVDLISKALANIEMQVHVNDDVVEDHPLAKLLQNPNPVQGGSDFWQAYTAFRLITGNPYMEKLLVGESGENGGTPAELWIVPPYQMKILARDDNPVPLGYLWEGSGRTRSWKTDPFNPLSFWYGLSPMEAAALSVDQHNSAGKWNTKLLQNSGSPSGFLMTEEVLGDAEYKQIKKRIDENYRGPNNAGEWMLMEGGLDWKQAGLSPKDMDWLEGKNLSAQDIAGVYGVPLQVIPIPGSQTFANYEQARAALYEDTVIPLMDSLVDELNRWLSPHYGENVRIGYDVDQIEALEVRRKERWKAIGSANWISINEKRIATGYSPIGGTEDQNNIHNKILVPSGLIPIDVGFGEPGEPE